MISGILRLLLRIVLLLAGAVMILVVFSLGPVDRTPVSEMSQYSRMLESLGKLDTVSVPQAASSFSVGYAAVNMTPAKPTATAGYGNRRGKLSTGIRDSIFVRTMVIDNGVRRVAIVSADLLIIPPRVTEQLRDRLTSIGFSLNNTYLSATHTHNSIGNWGEGAARFLYGKYDDDIVTMITEKILASLRLASENLTTANIRAGLIAVPDGVNNRIMREGPEDNFLRTLEVVRKDSAKLLLLSYTAHATCLFSKDLSISRDYPGALVDKIEEGGYDFAMFLSGAVGSHGFGAPMAGEECIDWMADHIASQFFSHRDALSDVKDTTIAMVNVPLLLSDPQVKISEQWKVRTWLFRSAMGEYPVFLTGLRIGNVVLLGTPCDFSGAFNPRLDSVAGAEGMVPIVTSFNGGYIGYVTPLALYDYDHYETQFMNWYAPGTGEYITGSLATILHTLARDPE